MVASPARVPALVSRFTPLSPEAGTLRAGPRGGEAPRREAAPRGAPGGDATSISARSPRETGKARQTALQCEEVWGSILGRRGFEGVH